jgi:hypothetical protein
MVADPAGGPQPMALAMIWVSRIFAISAEMILPGLLGQWLAKRWGYPSLVLLGFALGISFGLWHLILITRGAERARIEQKKTDRSNGD